MALALQQLINGLTLGAVYGLIAIGYTMVYGIIGMINFAHGDIYMVSAFIAVTGFTLLAAFGVSSVPFALVVVLIVAVLFTSVYGWAVERVAYRPLRGSTRLAPLISAIGMSIFLQNMVQLTQGARDQPAEADHQADRDQDDEDLRIRDAHGEFGRFIDIDAAGEHRRDRLDARALRQLHHVLQEDRHADRRDQRRQTRRTA